LSLDTTYLLEAPDNLADFFLVVRDRLNHASYVAWQTIHHTDSAVELLSRPVDQDRRSRRPNRTSDLRVHSSNWTRSCRPTYRISARTCSALSQVAD